MPHPVIRFDHALRISLLVLGSLVASAGQAASSLVTHYVSQEGGFSVQMPAQPVVSTYHLGGPASARTAHQYIVSLNADTISYAVHWNNPMTLTTPQDDTARLQEALAAARRGVRVQHQEAITRDGVPGYALAVVDSEGWHYQITLYVHAGRLYQICALSAPGKVAPDAQAFLDSFHFEREI